MSTTIDEIATFLDDEELAYGRHETEDAILLGFRLTAADTGYRDREGDAHLAFLIRVLENGEFVSVSMPWTWNLADCPHRAAVFQALLDFQARAKLVRFDYESADGELRANAEVGVEDSPFTAAQLQRLVRSVGNAVLELDPVIRHAMRTGEVNMDLAADPNPDRGARECARMRDLAAEAGGVEALEQLVCGERGAHDEGRGSVTAG